MRLRGRPRRHNPTIPSHIDQAALPRGLYWDKSGAGRWYVLGDRNPETGKPKAKTVAGPDAKLSELHAIMEARQGASTRGTIAAVIEAFHSSLDYLQLASTTKSHYKDYAEAIKAYPVKHGTLGQQFVDRLEPPVFRHLIDTIAKGKPASGSAPAVPGYPTKANHWLRYLRRAFGWGIEHGHCKTNPCRGVKCVKEVRNHRMPERDVFRAVQMYARACSLLGTREKGSLPPYLWAAMEIGYQARLRGIEVLTLTDAHNFDAELLTNRRKGSRDNLVRKSTNLARAIEALQAYRAEIWSRKKRPIPLRPEQRFLFVGEDGEPLSRRGFNTAWGRMMRAAVSDGVLTQNTRFGLHGLKHRGVTDTKGDKKKASGHKTDSMVHLYDHELPQVEPASDL